MNMEIPRRTPKEKEKRRMLALCSKVLVKLTCFSFIWDAITGETFANQTDYGIIVGYDVELIVALRTCLLVIETRLQEKRLIIFERNMHILFKTFTDEGSYTTN